MSRAAPSDQLERPEGPGGRGDRHLAARRQLLHRRRPPRGIEAKKITGPRMTSAGRYITTSNGLTDWYPDDAGVVEGGIGIRCDTLDEMIAEVRRQVKNRVDFIKLADSPFGEYQSFRDEELKAIADLAHQLNRRCTIHARGDAEMKAAVLAGFDWVMHGNIMNQDTVDLLAERQTPLVPTILLLETWAEYGPLIGAPPYIVDACKSMLERTHASLHMAHEAGVKFVVGTDTGFAMTPYGEWHAKELELLMKYGGLSELEAIAAGTYNGGVTLNLEGKVGGVAPETLADLLVVAGDPTEDITVLQDKMRIETIILDGEIIEAERDLESWPNEQSLTYAHRNLTQELVRTAAGSPSPAGASVVRSLETRSRSDGEVRVGQATPSDGGAQGCHRPSTRYQRRRARDGRQGRDRQRRRPRQHAADFDELPVLGSLRRAGEGRSGFRRGGRRRHGSIRPASTLVSGT